jgi:hypothetical protein
MDNLAELRTALAGQPGQQRSATRFDPGIPHPARVYNVWLGGKDHYPADREAAQEVIRFE